MTADLLLIPASERTNEASTEVAKLTGPNFKFFKE
jgi:hypothetical protein